MEQDNHSGVHRKRARGRNRLWRLLRMLLRETRHFPGFWWQVWRVKINIPRYQRISVGNHWRQYVMMALPEGIPRGLVIYWHGGGWQFGRPEQFRAGAQVWIDQGFGVIMPSYRRLPKNSFSEIEADTLSALRAAKEWLDQEGLPALPYALLGMSAGGHLAAITGLRKDILPGANWDRDNLLGIITTGAVLDLQVMPYTPIIRRLAGPKSGELFQRADPAQHLTEDAPACLVIHGKKDRMVPFRVAESFVKKYQEMTGKACAQLILPNGIHVDAGRWLFEEQPIRQKMIEQMNAWLPV